MRFNWNHPFRPLLFFVICSSFYPASLKLVYGRFVKKEKRLRPSLIHIITIPVWRSKQYIHPCFVRMKRRREYKSSEQLRLTPWSLINEIFSLHPLCLNEVGISLGTVFSESLWTSTLNLSQLNSTFCIPILPSIFKNSCFAMQI